MAAHSAAIFLVSCEKQVGQNLPPPHPHTYTLWYGIYINNATLLQALLYPKRKDHTKDISDHPSRLTGTVHGITSDVTWRPHIDAPPELEQRRSLRRRLGTHWANTGSGSAGHQERQATPTPLQTPTGRTGHEDGTIAGHVLTVIEAA